MKAKEVIDILDKLASPFLIDSWDNSGLQIGSTENEVDKILVSLDLSRESLDLALKEKVNMIVTHHPFIFEKLKNISLDDEKGNMIRDIIKNDITVFSMHTNLDICEGGINDELCRILDIESEGALSKFIAEELKDDKKYGYGRVGNLSSEMSFLEFSNIVNEKLICENLRIYGDLDKYVKRIAICGGSGASFIKDAYLENVDVYVTGDIKYHDAQLAKELGVFLLDAGHFETEKVAIDLLKRYIDENTKNIDVITFEKSIALYSTLN